MIANYMGGCFTTVLNIVYKPIYSSNGYLNYFMSLVFFLFHFLFLVHVYFIITTSYNILKEFEAEGTNKENEIDKTIESFIKK